MIRASLTCLGRSFKLYFRAWPQRGFGGSSILQPVGFIFPSSERWKNLEKLPPHPFHPFSCGSLAIKKHPGPLMENRMKGPVRSPAPFHLSGQCWPERTSGITCPSSPSATFHQTEIGNSPGWVHSEVVFSSCSWNKKYTKTRRGERALLL